MPSLAELKKTCRSIYFAIRIDGLYGKNGKQNERGRTELRYVCLVYGEESKIAAMTDDGCMAFDKSLRDNGRCVASEALQPVRTARSVQVRDGKVSVRDGPFTETKEILAGFYLIEAA